MLVAVLEAVLVGVLVRVSTTVVPVLVAVLVAVLVGVLVDVLVVVAVLVAVVAVHEVLVRALVKPEDGLSGQSVMTFDLVGISILTGDNHLPRFLDRGAPPLTVAEMKSIFDPTDNIPVLWVPRGKRGPGFV